jgi:FtsZ-binding cell division protein ZapB
MTDNEIIEVLECCIAGNCEYCSFADIDCMQKLRKEAIDLINRQKAEIERLKKESDEWARRFINRCRDYEFEIQQNEKLKAENESLKEAIKDLRHEMSYMTSPNTIGDRHEMGAW